MGIFEVKNKLSEVCEDVSIRGNDVVVTRHGKPLVRIIPYEEPGPEQSVWGTVAECRAKYGPLTEDFDPPPREVKSNREDPLG
ncbi:MAG: type II toxin-antitoxin system Phd/YefM family antitoxin [Kiritimatiellae bacterium]|nr:type II toxin-antitoxin system Phd/YefM family antitoxin [Kiritimatiellia bacterium]